MDCLDPDGVGFQLSLKRSNQFLLLLAYICSLILFSLEHFDLEDKFLIDSMLLLQVVLQLLDVCILCRVRLHLGFSQLKQLLFNFPQLLRRVASTDSAQLVRLLQLGFRLYQRVEHFLIFLLLLLQILAEFFELLLLLLSQARELLHNDFILVNQHRRLLLMRLLLVTA